MNRFRLALVAGFAVLNATFVTTSGHTCSRVLWNDNKLVVVVGRTMDWPESTEPMLTVFPRGMKRDGGRVSTAALIKDNPAKWTQKYGSLVTTIYGVGTADGFNEKGMAVHMLYLNATDFGSRDKNRIAVQAGLWGQYLLDNAATVGETLQLHESIQVVTVEINGHKSNVHLAIEDANGDSAIIEYIGTLWMRFLFGLNRPQG